MKTVLVHYKVLIKSDHWAVDDYYKEKSKIVKVMDLLALNDMFEDITNIKILENN